MSALRPPLARAPQACGCCPPRPIRLRLNVNPHPGFGIVYLKRDRETIEEDFRDGKVAWKYERIAAADPDHDWRLEIHGPMYGCVYQRHAPKEWLMVERLDGFA